MSALDGERMRYIIMFMDHSGPVGVGAVWADGSRWVRFYADESKDYPRPVFYDDRRNAVNHARAVTSWLKRNDGDFLNRTFSYKVLPIYNMGPDNEITFILPSGQKSGEPK